MTKKTSVKTKEIIKTKNPAKLTARGITNRFRKAYWLWLAKKRAGLLVGGAQGGMGKGMSAEEMRIYAQFQLQGPPGEGGKETEGAGFEDAESVKGIDIPKEYTGIDEEGIQRTTNLEKVNMFYSLIPHSPKPGEDIFAYAHLKWDQSLGEVIYNVVEPPITEEDIIIIENIKRELEERLDIDFVKIGEIKAKQILRQEIEKIFILLGPGIDENKKKTIIYYIDRDVIGLGKLQTVMNDPNIEDISCDGIGISLYVYHRDSRLGSLKTNLTFNTKDELDNFVARLAQKCKKSISIAEPLLDASLPGGSRVQATLGTDIARKGSNFTIRKFTQKPLTPTHMIKFGTLDTTQLAYLWLAIENRQSVLISGGSATGKTSLLNALSLFIRPSLKIVSIEDTAELRLPLPHWVPHVARTPISTEGEIGEVSLFDLLRSSLRQRPDYIIVGEVRGKETFVLFQQIATGHAGMATIHAASLPQLVDRLTTPPISLPATLLENINIVVFLVLSRLAGKSIRRTDKMLEILGVKNEKIVTNTIFQWQPMDDSFETKEKSVILNKLSKRLGISDNVIKNELIRRKIILEWMFEHKIFDYREVAKIIDTYYSSPEKIINLVGA
jgi:flagellar protein FlaI